MASGQFNITTTNSHVVGKVTWSSVANTAGNYSDVTVSMYLSRNNTGYTTSGSGTFTVYVGQDAHSTTKSFSITYNSNTLMTTGTTRVYHGADGKATVTITWSGSSDVFNVNGSYAAATLDNIARASTLTSGQNWTAPNDTTLYISRGSSSYTHLVRLYVNGILQKNYYGVTTSVNSAFSKADNEVIFQQMNGADSTPSKIEVNTYNGDTFIGTNTYNGTISAPTTAYATFSTPNFGDTINATLQNYDSRMTYKAEFTIGSFKKTFDNITTANPTFSFTQDEWNTIAQQNTNSDSIPGTVLIRTYYDGIEVKKGRSSGFTIKITGSNPVFTTIGYRDNNSKTKGVTGNDQYIVQNQSQFQAVITAANQAKGQTGATITKYIATINGVSLFLDNPTPGIDLVFDFGTINATSDQTLSVTAYDSRGNSTTVTKTVKVLPYSPPVVGITAPRLNGFDSTVTLTVNGTYSPLNINGANKNQLSANGSTYKFKSYNGAWSGNYTFTKITMTAPTYTTSSQSLNMNNTLSWTISVTIADSLSSTTQTIDVPVGNPILFLDTVKKSLGVGKFPDGTNSLEVSGSISAGLVKTTNFVSDGQIVGHNGAAIDGTMNAFGEVVTPSLTVTDTANISKLLMNGSTFDEIQTGAVAVTYQQGTRLTGFVTFSNAFSGTPRVVAVVMYIASTSPDKFDLLFVQNVTATGFQASLTNKYGVTLGTGDAIWVAWIAIH